MNRLVHRFFLMTVMITVLVQAAWSQSLIVNNETTGFNNFNFRDTSAEIRVQVRLSSAQTLQKIVPTLIPPACAVYQGEPLFDTTYVGYVSGASVVEAALPSLAQNNNATFVFRVHYFAGDDAICGSAPCNNNLYDFDLSYTHSGSEAAVMADVNDELSFGGAISGGYSIVNRVGTSGRGPQSCARIENSILPPMPYEGLDLTVLNDPASVILIGVDWDAHLDTLPQGFLEALDVFKVPVASNLLVDLYDLVINDGLTIAPPDEAIIDVNSNFVYNLAETLGGDGETLGPTDPDCNKQFWNFFDVTESPLSGLPNTRVKGSMGSWSNEFVSIDRGSQIIHHRETALFQAYPNECGVRDGLGTSRNNFEFNSLVFNEDQTVDVSITVPANWESSPGTLNSGYTLSWYYRNHETLAPATIVTGTNNMTAVTLSVPFSAANQYRIEARVTRNTSESIDPTASVISDRHDLSYLETGSEVFFNAEVNQVGGSQPDAYFDPGEIMVKPIRIGNEGSQTLTNVSVSIGSNTAGVEFAFGASVGSGRAEVFNGTLAPGQDVDLDLEFLLISSILDCQQAELFYEVNYISNTGFETSFTDVFTVAVNCEEVEQTFGLNGDWTEQECFGDPAPCQDSNCTNATPVCSGTDDWSYNAGSGAWTGASNVSSKYYELESPIFPVGFDGRFDMTHLPGFVFRLAGGVVEYRNCPNGANCDSASWSDFILPIESASGNSFYNPSTFPALDSFQDQIISNRRVFHDISSIQVISEDIPETLFNNNYVQFRLVFQVRDAATTGAWLVEDFDYTAFQPVEDNLFGLPVVNLAPCPEVFTFVPGVSANYQFEFYTSIEDFRDGAPAHTVNTTGVWDYPIPLSSTTYYAVVRDLDTNVERIWPMTANNEQDVPPFAPCADAWNSDFDEACDLVEDSAMNVLDLIAQRNGDLCVNR